MIHEPEENKIESPLKTLRELLGFTQLQFANLLGLSPNTVSRWERGEGKPTFTPGQWKKLLAEMARVNLGVENLPDDLSPGNHLVLSRGGKT
jgi:transcriptional regulator with XRE-family HTH domain